MKSRRDFLKNASLLAALPLFGSVMDALGAGFPKGKGGKIILRSSWQTVNIGDIGHTFGLLELLDKYVPEAEITLWPVSINNGVDDLLMKNYPKLKIVRGQIKDGKPDKESLQQAFNEAHIMLHGSGPYVVARKDLQAWWQITQKPYGIYGVTLNKIDDELQTLISNASFIYCRDTDSLKVLKALNLSCPVQEFAPDATFAINLHDDVKAAAYLASVGLKKDQFICAIPRLRHTPYFQIKNTTPTPGELSAYEKSMEYKEPDAAKLREVIIRWVRETGLKVLACPEMTYQVALSKEVLVDPLPEDIRKNVVWRDTYWNPDEAASVYKQARALVSFEMHSPIIAFHEGTPAIHLRQPTDTRKGQMWNDIGLSDWLFEIDGTSGKQIADALMKIHHDYSWAEDEMKKARAVVMNRQEVSMNVVKTNQ
jgi:polysaccharide pyruvyl transferase WcaK-like protein